MKRLLSVFLGILFCVSLAACKQTQPSQTEISGTLAESEDYTTGFMHTAGQDDYGRVFAEADEYNERVVGIFYFLWLSQAKDTTNITSLEEEGKAERALTDDELVPKGPQFTWWGEPMYGYYQVEDEWVVRKHVELFINAGLDFICFDCTNNDFYQKAAKTVLDILLEYHKMGYKVPKAMFMTNSDSVLMTENIYNAFYRRNTYDEIWFCGRGEKPWIISTYGTAGTKAEIKNRFYFKGAQWPNRGHNSNLFPWISWRYPQETFTDTTNGYTIQSVSVSQHTGIGGSLSDTKVSGVNFSISGLLSERNYPTLSDALKARYSAEEAKKYYNYNWGRGYSHATGTNNYENSLKNVNFEEQWATSIANEAVNLVFVTGWNEWVAQKQSKDPLLGDAYGYFVDTFDMEFSRDVEMMNGGYLDNCFLQMVANIRKYKTYGEAQATYYPRDSRNMFDLSNWADAPVYKDLVNETLPRDAIGAGGQRYKNETGRNDIAEVRAAADANALYFLVTTRENITEKSEADARWMNLFIGVEGQQNGWNGLGYVINRSLNGTAASVEKIENGKFVSAGGATTLVSGNRMLVRVEKSVLGIGSGKFGIQFKVTDNLQKDFDVTELYINGDCAPIGRINYSYYSE